MRRREAWVPDAGVQPTSSTTPARHSTTRRSSGAGNHRLLRRAPGVERISDSPSRPRNRDRLMISEASNSVPGLAVSSMRMASSPGTISIAATFWYSLVGREHWPSWHSRKAANSQGERHDDPPQDHPGRDRHRNRAHRRRRQAARGDRLCNADCRGLPSDPLVLPCAALHETAATANVVGPAMHARIVATAWLPARRAREGGAPRRSTFLRAEGLSVVAVGRRPGPRSPEPGPKR